MVKTRLKLLLISVPFAYHIACLAENTKHEVFPVLADIILLVYCFFSLWARLQLKVAEKLELHSPCLSVCQHVATQEPRNGFS